MPRTAVADAVADIDVVIAAVAANSVDYYRLAYPLGPGNNQDPTCRCCSEERARATRSAEHLQMIRLDSEQVTTEQIRGEAASLSWDRSSAKIVDDGVDVADHVQSLRVQGK
jgi:hypothetical protein